jgi:hypothetical protein
MDGICVYCDSVNGGVVFLLFLVAYLFVLFFYRSAQGKSAQSRIVMLFIQFSLLFFGSDTRWLAWLSVSLSSATSLSFLFF